LRARLFEIGEIAGLESLGFFHILSRFFNRAASFRCCCAVSERRR
jgi:hypothetical protein